MEALAIRMARLTSEGWMGAERGEEWREDSEEAVSGVLYKAADGSERTARADLSIICDGMYSSLRNKLSTPNIRHPSFFVGLLLHDAALPYANFGHVVLAKPSPILFYPISSTEVTQPARILPLQQEAYHVSLSHSSSRVTCGCPFQ